MHGRLPEIGLKLATRRTKRHDCSDVVAQIVQNGTVFFGASRLPTSSLTDFIPFACR